MNKVVLISQQGSGTNMLRDLLNYHDDISFHGEVFLMSLPKEEVAKRLADWSLEADDPNCTKLVGVDVKYNQLTDDLIKFFKEHNYKVIHLLRDPARTALKGLKRSGQSLSYDELVEHITFVNNMRQKVRGIFPEAYEIYYEAITKGRELTTIDYTNELFDLQRWLGVEPKLLRITNTGLIKRYEH